MKSFDMQAYWSAVLTQNECRLRDFFHPSAHVEWHNTNEHFTVEGFVRANCTYPGSWDGEIEKLVETERLTVTVVRVFSPTNALSFHVTSFFDIRDGLIASIEEYWGEDGQPPVWRRELGISSPIHADA